NPQRKTTARNSRLVGARYLYAVADRQKHRAQARGAHMGAIARGVRARAFGLQHVVGNDEPARRKLGSDQVKARDIQVLPQVEQNDIERSWEPGDQLPCIADMEAHLRAQARPLDLSPRVV